MQSPHQPDTTFAKIDSILGTPSAQKVIRVLAVWIQLPINEIILKTQISKSQIHLTINKLESITVVEQVSRGIYRLTEKPFVDALKKAQIAIVSEQVGQVLYELTRNGDDMEKETVVTIFAELITQWKPILETVFNQKLSSFANYLIDRQELATR